MRKCKGEKGEGDHRGKRVRGERKRGELAKAEG